MNVITGEIKYLLYMKNINQLDIFKYSRHIKEKIYLDLSKIEDIHLKNSFETFGVWDPSIEIINITEDTIVLKASNKLIDKIFLKLHVLANKPLTVLYASVNNKDIYGAYYIKNKFFIDLTNEIKKSYSHSAIYTKILIKDISGINFENESDKILDFNNYNIIQKEDEIIIKPNIDLESVNIYFKNDDDSKPALIIKFLKERKRD